MCLYISYLIFLCFIFLELSTNRDLQHHVNILDNIADDSDFGLQHFTYKNSKMMDIIYKYLMRTNYSSLLVS